MTTPPIRTGGDGAGALLRLAAGGLGASWLIATALSQHPLRPFDRVRNVDRTGTIIPNWRFFAPSPAIHDNRLAHRILWEDGEVSDWIETHKIVDRRVRDMIWYPERRRDKAVTDLCGSMIGALQQRRTGGVEGTPAYQTAREVVRGQIKAEAARCRRTVEGFQFVVCRDPGYDEDDGLVLIFASRFEPWSADIQPAMGGAS